MKNEKKIVWIINPYAVLPGAFGSTRHYDFASALCEKNFEFYIISSPFNHFEKKKSEKSSKDICIERIKENLNFVWISSLSYQTNNWRRIINIITFSRRIRMTQKVAPKPDLIIGSSPHLLGAYTGYKIAKKLKVPFVFEVRDIWPEALFELGLNRRSLIAAYLAKLEKIIMKKSDRIIGLMPYLQEYAKEKFSKSADKITWISNGVADRYLKPFSCGKNHRKFICTYAGTIGEAQDHRSIIECARALQKFPEIHIIFIGEGVRKKELLELSNKYKLDNVEFRDAMPKEKIFDFLKESDALLHVHKPSEVYKYGIPPSKLFDYMSAGRPIIFCSSARNNLIKEANCGVSCKPGSTKKLQRAILKLYRMPDKKRRILGQNGLRYVKKNYSISQLSKKLDLLITDLT